MVQFEPAGALLCHLSWLDLGHQTHLSVDVGVSEGDKQAPDAFFNAGVDRVILVQIQIAFNGVVARDVAVRSQIVHPGHQLAGIYFDCRFSVAFTFDCEMHFQPVDPVAQVLRLVSLLLDFE